MYAIENIFYKNLNVPLTLLTSCSCILLLKVVVVLLLIFLSWAGAVENWPELWLLLSSEDSHTEID